jgi:SAM-dependent methyltransferase
MRVLSMLALLALALLAAPLAAEAQQPGKVYRIGILRDGLAHHPRHRLGPSWRRCDQWAHLSVAERHLSNVELIGGDAAATGLPRASFDLAHARLLLINVRHPARVVTEMVEVVRPGGLVMSSCRRWIGTPGPVSHSIPHGGSSSV